MIILLVSNQVGLNNAILGVEVSYNSYDAPLMDYAIGDVAFNIRDIGDTLINTWSATTVLGLLIQGEYNASGGFEDAVSAQPDSNTFILQTVGEDKTEDSITPSNVDLYYSLLLSYLDELLH